MSGADLFVAFKELSQFFGRGDDSLDVPGVRNAAALQRRTPVRPSVSQTRLAPKVSRRPAANEGQQKGFERFPCRRGHLIVMPCTGINAVVTVQGRTYVATEVHGHTVARAFSFTTT